MKRRLIILLIYLPVITLVFCFLVNLMARKQNMTFCKFIQQMKETHTGNILYNGNFKDDFMLWDKSYHGNFSLTNINGITAAKLFNSNGSDVTLFQKVKLDNKHSYILSFKTKTNSSDIVGIYSDDKTNIEDLVFCKKADAWVDNNKIIKPLSGNYGKISLSIRKAGEAYFTDVSLKDIYAPNKCRFLYLIYTYFIILLIIVLISLFVEGNITTFSIFCFLFILPIVCLDKSKSSSFEKRNLAIFKPLYKDKKINLNFGHDFNEWLNDRFTGRTYVMQVNTIMKCLINRKIANDTVFAGKDRWYFRKDNLNSIVSYDVDNSQKYEQIKKSLLRFSTFCKKHNTDLYILVCPSNEELYDQYLTGIKLGNKKFTIGKTIENLKRDTGINLIYAKDTMEKAKSEGLVCFKADHHWTQLAAFRCYQRIISEISKFHSGMYSLADEDFVIKDNQRDWSSGYNTQFDTLNIPNWCKNKFYPKDAIYKLYFPRKQKSLSKENEIMINKNGINKKVFVFGDSMTHYIVNFFWYTFAKTKYYYKYETMHIKIPEKLIEEFEPEITVMVIHYSNFEGIKKWYE